MAWCKFTDLKQRRQIRSRSDGISNPVYLAHKCSLLQIYLCVFTLSAAAAAVCFLFSPICGFQIPYFSDFKFLLLCFPRHMTSAN
jgi:hypothetical protein